MSIYLTSAPAGLSLLWTIAYIIEQEPVELIVATLFSITTFITGAILCNKEL